MRQTTVKADVIELAKIRFRYHRRVAAEVEMEYADLLCPPTAEPFTWPDERPEVSAPIAAICLAAIGLIIILSVAGTGIGTVLRALHPETPSRPRSAVAISRRTENAGAAAYSAREH